MTAELTPHIILPTPLGGGGHTFERLPAIKTNLIYVIFSECLHQFQFQLVVVWSAVALGQRLWVENVGKSGWGAVPAE